MISYFFLNLLIKRPLEIGEYLQVIIVKYLGLASHTEIFDSEVSLLVDVAVVVL